MKLSPPEFFFYMVIFHWNILKRSRSTEGQGYLMLRTCQGQKPKNYFLSGQMLLDVEAVSRSKAKKLFSVCSNAMCYEDDPR